MIVSYIYQRDILAIMYDAPVPRINENVIVQNKYWYVTQVTYYNNYNVLVSLGPVNESVIPERLLEAIKTIDRVTS